MEERSSGFVVYCLKEGQPLYLLLRSSRNDCWGLPKGKLDPGETDHQAALRELAEETGITDIEPHDGFERTITYWFTRSGQRIHKAVRYFLARVSSQDVRISSEHSEFGWFTLEQARERIVFSNLREAVVEAEEFTRRG